MPRDEYEDEDDAPQRGKVSPLVIGLVVGAIGLAAGLAVAGAAVFYTFRQAPAVPPPAVVQPQAAADPPLHLGAGVQAPNRFPGRRAIAKQQGSGIDWLVCEITGVHVGRVPVRDLGQAATSKEEYLVINFRVYTNDPTKQYAYEHWPQRAAGRPQAVDNFGNSYALADFGFGTELWNATIGANVTADHDVHDVIALDKPVPAAQFVDLDLPDDRVKPGSAFLFRIPAVLWVK